MVSEELAAFDTADSSKVALLAGRYMVTVGGSNVEMAVLVTTTVEILRSQTEPYLEEH